MNTGDQISSLHLNFLKIKIKEKGQIKSQIKCFFVKSKAQEIINMTFERFNFLATPNKLWDEKPALYVWQ